MCFKPSKVSYKPARKNKKSKYGKKVSNPLRLATNLKIELGKFNGLAVSNPLRLATNFISVENTMLFTGFVSNPLRLATNCSYSDFFLRPYWCFKPSKVSYKPYFIN